jgi:hypothetical protein
MIFFVILVFSAVHGNAKDSPVLAPETDVKRIITFSESGMVILESSQSGMLGSVDDLFLPEGFGAESGYMLLLLGSQEYVEFEKGELTRYFCATERFWDNKCRAKIFDGKERPFSFKLSTGGIINDKHYEINLFLFDKHVQKKFGAEGYELTHDHELTPHPGIN